MNTYVCGSGSDVAAVRSAVDREAEDASREQSSEKMVTYTCVPYEWNLSQNVEKCTVDLVLSSSTHTNAVQATAVAPKGAGFPHQSP